MTFAISKPLSPAKQAQPDEHDDEGMAEAIIPPGRRPASRFPSSAGRFGE
jgi:hypothetical protein